MAVGDHAGTDNVIFAVPVRAGLLASHARFLTVPSPFRWMRGLNPRLIDINARLTAW
jgi:hypothetical protein